VLTISIFTRKKNKKLLDLISDLKKQGFSNFQVKIYSDKTFKLENIKVIETKWKNISQKRNQAIIDCKTDFLFLLDDDNRIYNQDFLKNLFNYSDKIQEKHILSPVIYWRDTEIIQSAGIRFCYILWKVFANKKIKWNFWTTAGIWGNSLFWKTKNFKKASFDEEIWFIREDIDYSYSLRENWVKIFVVNEKINHQERDKTEAEKSFLVWEAYKRKIKNRNIFIKKHWNILQKIAYWLIWYWLWIIYWKFIKLIKK